jgi:hypothetical protein
MWFRENVRWACEPITGGPGPSRATASRLLRLHWWTGLRAVGTEHAAIARLRSQPSTAIGAHIEELACIGRHRFQFRGTATWARDDRLEYHDLFLELRADVRFKADMSDSAYHRARLMRLVGSFHAPRPSSGRSVVENAMLDTADFFETQIKQCTETAAHSRNKNDREFWLKMAARWEGLLEPDKMATSRSADRPGLDARFLGARCC